MGWVLALGAALAAVGWVGYRRRLARLGRAGLTDAEIRGLERTGRLDVEEPLDLEATAEEEERFWDESWDQPEPW